MAFEPGLAPFPPGRALDIVEARVRFGNDEQSVTVQPGDAEATMEFSLVAGETTLQTWFKTRDGVESGAYYVYIHKKE